jgi:uncharacterized membrane protein
METLHAMAHWLAVALEVIAIAIIAFGAVEAVVAIARVAVRHDVSGDARRRVWLMFARWLVAAMTFQLGADLVSTSFDPTWDELGRLAVVAVVRTFLSYFLDREVEDTRRRQHGAPVAAEARREA